MPGTVSPGAERTVRSFLAAHALFFGVFLFYMFYTGQHPFWLDSAEFAAMGRSAGIAHPPGSPLYLLLANLASLIPIGNVAFRVNLLSALAGAVSAVLMFEIGRRLIGQSARRPPPPAEPGTPPPPAGEANTPLVPLPAGGEVAPRAPVGSELRRPLPKVGDVTRLQTPSPGEAGDSPAPGRGRRPLASLASFSVAAAVAVSPAIWFQSVRAEVYGLQSALCLGMVYVAIRWREEPSASRYPLLCALLLGLGLTNHYLIALVVAAALLVYVLAAPTLRHRMLGCKFIPSPDAPTPEAGTATLELARDGGHHGLAQKARFGAFLALARPALLLLLGLLPLLYLPIRASRGFSLWGDPTTLSGFWSMISARAFHLSVTEMPVAPLPEALLTIFAKWIDLLGAPLCVAGLAGLIAFLLTERRTGLLLLLLILAGAMSKAVMYLDVENPDDHAYFLIGLQALALASLGLMRLARPVEDHAVALAARARLLSCQGPGAVTPADAEGGRRRAKVLSLAPFFAAFVVVVTAGWSARDLYLSNASACDMSRFVAPDIVNRHFQERVPPDALFMPSYYATFFNHLYYRGVEQRRPDVTMVHQSLFSRFDSGRGYRKDVEGAHPEVGPLFDEYEKTNAFPLSPLLALSRTRPVLLENDTTEVIVGSEGGTTAPSSLAEFSLGPGGLTVPVAHLSFVGPGLLLRFGRYDWARQHEMQKQFWTAFYRDMEGTPQHPEVLKHLVWYHYRNALYFINDQNWVGALLEARMAHRFAPESEKLGRLEAELDK